MYLCWRKGNRFREVLSKTTYIIMYFLTNKK